MLRSSRSLIPTLEVLHRRQSRSDKQALGKSKLYILKGAHQIKKLQTLLVFRKFHLMENNPFLKLLFILSDPESKMFNVHNET